MFRCYAISADSSFFQFFLFAISVIICTSIFIYAVLMFVSNCLFACCVCDILFLLIVFQLGISLVPPSFVIIC